MYEEKENQKVCVSICPATRAHLTEYSYLDSIIKQPDYVDRAAEIGFSAAGISNHGNIDGCIKFKTLCQKKDIHSVLGCELYFVLQYPKEKEKPDVKHVCAFAKSMKGFQSLCRILSVAGQHKYYSRPLIDFEDLVTLADDLVITAACASGLYSYSNWKAIIDLFQGAFGKDFYAEIMPLRWAPQFEINQRVLESGIPFIPSTDAHYINREDSVLQEVFLAVQKKQRWNDPDRWKFDIQGDLCIQTPDELVESFAKLRKPISPAVVKKGMLTSFEIAEKCIFEWEQIQPEIPSLPTMRKATKKQELEFMIKQVLDGMEKKGVTSEAHQKRAERELNAIARQDYVRYFLIVWELHNWARSKGIFCGIGRGSVGGSIVAYAMDITKIDPLKYGLLFERFISPDRVDMPDIDMDFEDTRRDQIIEHLRELYGKESVCHISTVSVARARQALKDVSRVFDVPLHEVNDVCKHIVVRSGGDARADFSLEDSFKTFEKAKRFQKKFPQVCKFAGLLEGTIKTSGIHAAGIVLSPNDLYTSGQCVLAPRKSFERVANWDRFDIEERGLVKFDVLGLKALSRLHDAQDLMAKRGVVFDIDEVPLDDPKVYTAYSKGKVIGAFQMTGGIRKTCEQVGVASFEQIADVIALYRPGTLRTGWMDDYKNRKLGKEKIPNQHPIINKITRDTFGILLYQEQVMQLLTGLAGFSPKETDGVRKTISKVLGEMEFRKVEEKFVAGCLKKKTMTEREARALFKNLKHWGSYGFNKSHSVEYGLISYLDVWLKVNYPWAFYPAALNHLDDNAARSALIRDASQNGFKVSLPDINNSTDKWNCEDKKLLCPLSNIKGMGVKATQHILETRKVEGKFTSIEHFYNSVEKRIVNSLKMKVLLKAGAFDRFGVFQDLNEEERIKLAEENLAFRIDFDPFREHKKLMELLAEQLPITDLKMVPKKSRMKELLVCGVMEEVKFTYPKDIEKKLKKGGAIWGGVYGRLRDKSSFLTINFSTEAYKKYKEDLEQAADKCVLALGKRKGEDNIMASDVWFLDQIRDGQFNGIPFRVNSKPQVMKASYRQRLDACEACILHQKATQKVPAVVGKTSYTVIGEAPGRTEDKKGLPFVGRAGKEELWPALEAEGFKREFFSVSNICKCRPSGNKKPTPPQMKICSAFLQEEIERLHPKAILVMGATALEGMWPKIERGDVGGISELNGTVRYSEKWGAFLVFSYHPASILYNTGNRKPFREATERFAELIHTLEGDD